MRKSITFLLPSVCVGPSGGPKVAFEYANYLAAHGYDVHIVYPVSINFKQTDFFSKIKAVLRYPYRLIMGWSAKSWFRLDKSVKEHFTLSLSFNHVPKTTFYVATAVTTSYYVAAYPIDCHKKLYLIQGFENWGVSEEYVYQSYCLGLKNIVISNWLAKRVEYTGATYTLIKNGFDFDYFKLTVPVEDRDKYSVSMLYHLQTRKGCEYGLEALKKVRAVYPQLKACFFGTPARPADLPDWIDYYQRPNRETHNRIYNLSAIYLAPSLQEGWGLTVGEAMICGNAIVCTDTLGFQEMVTNGKEGLIVPAKNASALAEALINLIENSSSRIKMAKTAVKTISGFNWDHSFKLFESLLTNEAQSGLKNSEDKLTDSIGGGKWLCLNELECKSGLLAA